MAARKKAPSFEEGLERLEAIASQMERGELSLDELLKLYEEGMKLSAELTRKLDEANGRMLEVRMNILGETEVTQTDVVSQQNPLDD